MKKFLICKTVVPFGQGTMRYYLFFPLTGFRMFGSLVDVADYLAEYHEDESVVAVKNEAPCDVMLMRDDTPAGLILEFERLSRNEVHDLVRLLRQR